MYVLNIGFLLDGGCLIKIFIKFYFINVLCIIMIGRKMMIEYFCGEDEIEYIINEYDYSYDLLKLYR